MDRLVEEATEIWLPLNNTNRETGFKLRHAPPSKYYKPMTQTLLITLDGKFWDG
jgi:hypothetical protein